MFLYPIPIIEDIGIKKNSLSYIGFFLNSINKGLIKFNGISNSLKNNFALKTFDLKHYGNEKILSVA